MTPSCRQSARDRLAAFVVIGLFGAGLVLAGCGKKDDGAEEMGHGRAHTEDSSSVGIEEEDHSEHPESVELSPEAVHTAGIRVGVAGPASIAVTADAPGEVRLNAERVLEVRPRYPGVIRELRKRIGDAVRDGEVVATVQGNESLSDYEIVSSMSGTVIGRSVVTGQLVDHETVIYLIADLSSVWVDFAVYPDYVGRIRPGMSVTVVAQNRPDLQASATIQYVGPILEQETRSSNARVVLQNPRALWQPGLFVTARVTLDRASVPVAVPEDAILRTADGIAVFRAYGTRFDLQPVLVGRTDGRTTEIRQGLSTGDSIVVGNAFVLKSELGKSEAGHDH